MGADRVVVEVLAVALVYWNDSLHHGWHRLSGVDSHRRLEAVEFGVWVSTHAFDPDLYFLLAFVEVERDFDQARGVELLLHVSPSLVLTHAF